MTLQTRREYPVSYDPRMSLAVIVAMGDMLKALADQDRWRHRSLHQNPGALGAAIRGCLQDRSQKRKKWISLGIRDAGKYLDHNVLNIYMKICSNCHVCASLAQTVSGMFPWGKKVDK
ncbi:hypothetical protein [Acidisoma sp.]|uniref:hypothetical protein n=1 Tax=Acidisoma sp. TaxID=1872115 RepID=UPI002D7E68B1|nr:hypothetical protein [Acidisoma sp.]